MTWAQLLLFGLAAWTAIGVVGSLLSGVRRSDWPKARRGLRTIAVVWGIYLLVLLGVAHGSPERVLPQGTPQCFAEMCFAVADVQQLTGYAGRGQTGGRLLRVSIRVSHRGQGSPEQDLGVRAYLRDSAGRRWYALPGVSGVPLTTLVPAGATVVSQPVYALPADAHGLGLILTHGHWQTGRLVIGDPDSLLHAPVVLHLVEPTSVQPFAP